MLISYSAGDHLGAELQLPSLNWLLFYAINAYQWPLFKLLIYCQCDHQSSVSLLDMLTGQSDWVHAKFLLGLWEMM